MRNVAHLVSWIFHPLFLVFLLILLAYGLDGYRYYFNDDRAIGAFFFMNFFLLVLFPLVGIGLLVGLKMISGFTLAKREDRIGPLIITLAFYIWYFINIKDNPAFPDTLRMVALGITISAGLAFFINNFTKVSLHTIGAGSFLTAVVLLIYCTKTSFFDMNLGELARFRLSSIFVLLFSFMLAGIVGSARLYLKAHTTSDIYAGYLVGFIAQVLALRIILI